MPATIIDGAWEESARYLSYPWLQVVHLKKIALAYLTEKAVPRSSRYPSGEVEDVQAQQSRSILFGPEVLAPQISIHEAFKRHAREHPNLVAVKHLSSSLTYHELDVLSDRLAAHLRGMGIGSGKRVVLLVSRSPEMVVGIFAALKAGAAYVPLDGGIVTDQTLQTILEDAEPSAVLCLGKFVSRLDGANVQLVDIETFVNGQSNDGECVERIEDHTQPSDEAYIIYTSGTTGRPKGVSVSHANVTNLILLHPGSLSIRPGTRVSQLLNIAFDMAAWEILGTLANGGTLVLRPSGSNCADWMATLRDVDVVIATPSILAQFEASELENIKVVATAGERCPQKLADKWAEGRMFWNCCGPTETTIINTAHLHTPGAANTIGRPTPNNTVYVLDSTLRPVPEGVSGTIWAGGAGVCRGYVGLSALNAEKFLQDPFSPFGGVMYNTGDIGRLRADDELDHLGREDDQVKIKGFRVELDGVAAAMSSCPGITLCAAVLVNDELWGFYEPQNVSEKDIRSAVERIQPYYARPAMYVGLEKVPLTRNGKVDRGELRAMAETLRLDRKL